MREVPHRDLRLGRGKRALFSVWLARRYFSELLFWMYRDLGDAGGALRAGAA